MFEYQGPIGAINTQRSYIMANFAALPPGAQPRFEAVALERGPAEALVNGLETFYAALRELEMPSRPDALTALGAVAQVVYQDDVWDSGPRALEIVRWAKQERDGVPEGAEPVEAPEIAQGKSFLEPEPSPLPDPPPAAPLP